MAYFDHAAAARDKECAAKYEELKKFISSKDKKGKLSEWLLAYEHIMKMEQKLTNQAIKINEYQKFFSSLNSLLPRQSSVNDIIG